MIIRDLSGDTLTVSIDGFECEQLAKICRRTAQSSAEENLASFFIAAAMVCQTYGFINLPAEVQEKIGAIRERVQREE